MKKRIIALIAAVAVTALGGLYYLAVAGASPDRYTQIDGSRLEIIDPSEGGVVNLRGSMPYRYELPCYNGQGRAKEIAFTADRELREGAFLRLRINPLRGVTFWEEVRFDELPAAVQRVYAP